MSAPRELDEETLIELKERREEELELFQEPSIFHRLDWPCWKHLM